MWSVLDRPKERKLLAKTFQHHNSTPAIHFIAVETYKEGKHSMIISTQIKSSESKPPRCTRVQSTRYLDCNSCLRQNRNGAAIVKRVVFFNKDVSASTSVMRPSILIFCHGCNYYVYAPISSISLSESSLLKRLVSLWKQRLKVRANTDTSEVDF
jgi:hypothetical protein